MKTWKPESLSELLKKFTLSPKHCHGLSVFFYLQDVVFSCTGCCTYIFYHGTVLCHLSSRPGIHPGKSKRMGVGMSLPPAVFPCRWCHCYCLCSLALGATNFCMESCFFFWWKFIEGFFIILLFCYIFWMCFKTTFVRIDSQIAFASLFRWHLKKWNITFVSDGCCKGDPYADSMGFSALHWIPQFLPWNLFTKKPATFFIKFEVLTGSSWLKLHFLPVAYFFDCHMVVSCKFLFLSKIEGWIIVWLRFFEALLWSSSMARSSTICKKTGGFFHDEMDFFLSPPAVGFQLAMKSVGVRWGYIHGDGLGKKALLVLPVMTQYNVAWLILESSKELKLVKWGSFACTVAELCNGSTIVVGSCCNNKNQLLETWKGSRTFFHHPQILS